MVYCGRLSKGCERCRRRKIKCDQQRPACLQCVRARTQCPGYRDLVDVMFRDESASVARKLNGQDEKSGRSHGNEIEILAVAAPSQSLLPARYSHPEPHSGLSLPLKDQAAAFFFAHYVISDPPFAEMYVRWLSQLFWRESESQILHAAVESVGLAGMSNVNRAPPLMKEARQIYGRALKITNKALRDPREATTDSTLVSILFLGLFETITCEDWQQYHPWNSHVGGAAALFELRGQQQLERELGNIIFVQMRTEVLELSRDSVLATPLTSLPVTGCMKSSTSVPAGITKWLKKPTADEPVNPNVYQQDCLVFSAASIASLRELIKTNPDTSPETIISSALDIDADLSTFDTRLSPHWAHSTVFVTPKQTQECFEGFYYVYKYLWVAQAWNSYRLLRVMVHQIIFQYLDRQSSPEPVSTCPATASQYQKSRKMVRQLCSDICATVPMLLGSYPNGVARAQQSTQRATGGLCLLWPLFAGLCRTPQVDRRMQHWAIRRLQYIDEEMGIRQAGLMADTLLGKKKYDIVHV